MRSLQIAFFGGLLFSQEAKGSSNLKQLVGQIGGMMQSFFDATVCDIPYNAPLWEIFDQVLEGTGVGYEEHEVITEDGYILNLVRLIKAGVAEGQDRGPPMLFQHGIASNSENWLTLSDEHEDQTAVPLQALERGYDVWLGNNRGSRYSLRHENDKAWEGGEFYEQPDYWNFTFDKMGTKDLPAFIDKILDTTHHEKLVYVGYSMGTMQMYYALAKDDANYFKDRVAAFVSLAVCTKLSHSAHPMIAMGASMFDRVVSDVAKAKVHAVYGPDWEHDLNSLCGMENPLICAALGQSCVGSGQTIPIGLLMHAMQSKVKDDFVEYDPEFKKQAQLTESQARVKSVDLSKVPDIPIHMVQGTHDTVCSPTDTNWAIDQMRGVKDLTLSKFPMEHTQFMDGADLSYFQTALDWLQDYAAPIC